MYSWSRNGRYLLSASKDWSCILWDLTTGKEMKKIRFDTPLMMAQMHPTDKHIFTFAHSFKFVAALFQDAPVIVDMNNGKVERYELPNDLPVDEDGTSDKDQVVKEK
jgi:COMPASS component SWD1